MKIFTKKEKLLIRILLTAAAVGIIIGSLKSVFNHSENDIERELSGNTSLTITVVDSSIGSVMDAKKVYQENTSTLNVSITNINTANKNELMSLPNIGTVKVEEIIRFREKYGKFMKVDDLLKVSGIEPKTLEKLKPFVTI